MRILLVDLEVDLGMGFLKSRYDDGCQRCSVGRRETRQEKADVVQAP